MATALQPARIRHLVAPRWRPQPIELAIGLGGLSVAVLVGIDGSPGWRVVRVLIVGGATALLVRTAARLAPRSRGRLAIAVGLPMVAVAVGFSPHWAKGGPVPVQAATAVLVLAGLTLLAGGTATATQGRRWWRRGLGGLGAVVAAGLVTFVVGPAVATTNVPRPDIGATPANVGLDHEDVTLQTADGVELAAWYVPSTNRAAVVLLHGAGSTRSNVLDEAAVLADAGFGVLMVDARGHGESAGRAMDFGWHGDADVAAATTYLAARPDVDPDRIGAVGSSMGGEEAIGASGSNAVLKAVVAEGATARAADDHDWLSDRFGFRGAVQEQIQRAQELVTDTLTSASVPRSLRDAAASSGRVRYLLIAAGDVPDEGEAADHIAAGARGRVTVWIVPGAGHTDGLEVAREEWIDRVVGFLQDTLIGGRAPR